MEPRRLESLSAAERSALVDRGGELGAIREDVAEIVATVREDGDDALRAYAAEFDDVAVESIDITDRVGAAADAVADEVREAIEHAARNIRTFHERQVPLDWREEYDGRTVGRRFRAVASAGVYVPGGTAAYPSSALMGVIPAVVAGVDHVAVATPPAAELHPATAAAIREAGADRVYQMGGAQAVAALAYGTETVDAVDLVVGPGNRWVTAAKAAVRGDVGIDFLAGPSEVLVLADGSADAGLVAAELVAQAEHDPDASVVAVTDDPGLAGSVADAVAAEAAGQPREETIRAALANDASGVLVADSMDAAAAFAEAYAPEHLAIHAADAERLLDAVPSAGSAFLGSSTPVAAGDYATGPNHVLPTGGQARLVGGLSVDTFLRSTTVQRLDGAALAELQDTITTLARAEGLEAHARSVERRFED
ncbi:MAG: histidinol dehydrogenase [Halobacteriales archaeon]|nr:histidinol dehydrogenase [Halobacteriales archaeon]